MLTLRKLYIYHSKERLIIDKVKQKPSTQCKSLRKSSTGTQLTVTQKY